MSDMIQNGLMEKYPWAINQEKLARAHKVLSDECRTTKVLTAAGTYVDVPPKRSEFTEEDVKELYVRFGGALLEEAAAEMEKRAGEMKHAGPIQKVVEAGAQKLKERVSKLRKPAKKAD